jgi:hypothetical protein
MTSLAPPVSDALAAVLTSGRAHFNSRVSEARHRYPAFDAMAFAAFLRTGLDSVARSVAEITPERTAPVVLDAYDIALELVAQGQAGAGARNDLVERVWTELVPKLARLVVAEPVDVLGALSNAAIYIASVPTARGSDWLDGMVALAQHADSNAILRSLGTIMAWRAGLAHFREGALQCADALPESLALLAVGANDTTNWPAIRDAYRANPWWSPLPSARDAILNGMDAGQFTGFGGTFAQPPTVRACPQGFLVRSADRFSLLVADIHGAVLLPATPDEYASAEKATTYPPVQITRYQLLIGDRRIDTDLPEDGFAAVGNEHTIAVTSPYSHLIRLLPRA